MSVWGLAEKRSRLPLYVVCPSCGRITATDTGFCRHCRFPLFSIQGLSLVPPPGYSFDLRLGKSLDDSVVGVSLRDLQRHLIVYGVVGSGKTSFAKRLVFEAGERGLNFLVLDWSGEYRGLGRSIGGEVLEARVDSERVLRIDLFSSWLSVPSVYAEWVSGLLLESLRERGWDVSPMMELVVKRSVKRSVEAGVEPREFLDILWDEAKRVPQGHLIGAALEARFTWLFDGVLSSFLGKPDTLGDPTRGRLVVDLGWLSTTSPRDARILAYLVMARLYYSVARRGRVDRGLWMVVVIDEAEEIAPRRSSDYWSRGPTGLGSYLMHLRRHGVGVVVIAHSPSLVDSSLRRVVGSIAVFRLNSPEDVDIASRSLGIGVESVVRSLGVGECVFKPASLASGFIVRVEPIAERIESGLDSGKRVAEVILDSVYKHPELSLSERRSFLGLDSRAFREGLEYLVSKRIARIVEVYQGVGRPAKVLEPRGMNPSAVHQYLVIRAANMLRSSGYSVVFSTKGPDIVVEVSGGRRIGVEIETGSNVNLGKYEKFLEEYDGLIIVCSSRSCMSRVRRVLKKTSRPSRVCVTALSFLIGLVKRMVSALGAGVDRE